MKNKLKIKWFGQLVRMVISIDAMLCLSILWVLTFEGSSIRKIKEFMLIKLMKLKHHKAVGW